MSSLKAFFFVRDFKGGEYHPSPKDFSMERMKKTPGLKVRLTFSDGEVIYSSFSTVAKK